MLKLTEPAADAVGGAAHFLHSVQVRQEDAAVVLLLEAPPALEMHIEPARAVRCCAPRGRVHHFEVDGHERREPALVLARAHDARSRDCCHRRLFATVMPNRLGDSRVTIGPPGALRMRRPVRLLIRFSAHHSGNVRTWLSFKSAGSTMVGSIRLKPPPPDCLRLLRCLRRNIDEHPHVGMPERVDAQKQTSPPEHRVARCASSGPVNAAAKNGGPCSASQSVPGPFKGLDYIHPLSGW